MKRTPLQRRTPLRRAPGLSRKGFGKRGDRSPVVRACEWCGEEFEARQEHRNFTRRFCGNACSARAQQAKAIASYPPREEVVRLYADEGLSDAQLGRRFGRSYQWAFKVRRYYGIAGEDHRRTKPLRRQRDRARWGIHLKREECCRNCKREGVHLDLHHVVPRSKNPAGKYDLRNGVPLCRSCHTKWHGGTPICRDIFTAEEWSFISTLAGPGWLGRKYPKTRNAPSVCPNGHPRTEENTYVSPRGIRSCRVCREERRAEHNRRRDAVERRAA